MEAETGPILLQQQHTGGVMIALDKREECWTNLPQASEMSLQSTDVARVT